MNIYRPSDIRRVAMLTYLAMMRLNPAWTWTSAKRPVTPQMVQDHLEETWVDLTSPMKGMPAEESENYATSLVESGGIACALEEGDHAGVHHMAVYVRIGTI